ncbi:hypothetical protein BC940DRAFT_313723 [Gongronella butleri]|nr:hypothetical protein BC940DRAFT_313723 [Gongronella butleri]
MVDSYQSCMRSGNGTFSLSPVMTCTRAENAVCYTSINAIELTPGLCTSYAGVSFLAHVNKSSTSWPVLVQSYAQPNCQGIVSPMTTTVPSCVPAIMSDVSLTVTPATTLLLSDHTTWFTPSNQAGSPFPPAASSNAPRRSNHAWRSCLLSLILLFITLIA